MTCHATFFQSGKIPFINFLLNSLLAYFVFPSLMDHHQNVWLISVPTGRFVADASLSLQKTFVADASLSLQKTFVADASLSLQKTFVAVAALQSLICDADSREVTQFPPQSTIYIVDVLTKVIHNFW